MVVLYGAALVVADEVEVKRLMAVQYETVQMLYRHGIREPDQPEISPSHLISNGGQTDLRLIGPSDVQISSAPRAQDGESSVINSELGSEWPGSVIGGDSDQVPSDENQPNGGAKSKLPMSDQPELPEEEEFPW